MAADFSGATGLEGGVAFLRPSGQPQIPSISWCTLHAHLVPPGAQAATHHLVEEGIGMALHLVQKCNI